MTRPSIRYEPEAGRLTLPRWLLIGLACDPSTTAAHAERLTDAGVLVAGALHPELVRCWPSSPTLWSA